MIKDLENLKGFSKRLQNDSHCLRRGNIKKNNYSFDSFDSTSCLSFDRNLRCRLHGRLLYSCLIVLIFSDLPVEVKY
jgi:hypothetical protein